jgi:Domain of unknown function (DUF1906)
MITILDTDEPLTEEKIIALMAKGVVSVGRYLNRHNPSEGKVIKPAEAHLFAKHGLRLFLIYEFDGKPSGTDIGKLDGEYCVAYAPTVGAPTDGSAFIAYTVDWDAPESAMPGIKEAFAAFRAAVSPKFKVWPYASGAVNAELYTDKLADGRWLTCSTGFRGSKEALAAGDYEMRQSVPAEVEGLDTDPDTAHVATMTIGFVPFGVPAAGALAAAPSPSPSATPRSNAMNNSVKPWYASQTVWGALAAIAGGLGGVVFGALNGDTPTILVSVTAAAGGFHALVGRFKATTPIGRALHSADTIVQTGLAIESELVPAAKPAGQ